jgi:hypothetical protein
MVQKYESRFGGVVYIVVTPPSAEIGPDGQGDEMSFQKMPKM